MGGANRTYRWEKEQRQLSFTIPWDRITAKSFLLSLLTNALLIWLMSVFLDVTPELREPEYNTIPIRLIDFGLGKGEGASGGNLTKPGKAQKGPRTKNPLEDAARAPRLRSVDFHPRQYQAGDKPIAVRNFTAETPARTQRSEKSKDRRDVGNPDAEDFGLGLGKFGDGKGSGYGYSLQWGSGGNRIVLHKELPEYPPGVRTAAQIRLRFTVKPDGSIGMIIPLQKGDPALEQAAMRALRRWKFNPLDSNITMVGIITFTFTLE